MTVVDPYRITDQLNEDVLSVIVTRLEARGAHPVFQQVLGEYLEAMNVDSASHVLDIGSGTGVAARAIAKCPNFSGKVTGIDLSPHLVMNAKRLATEEGLEGRVEFQAGDTQTLDFPQGSFDTVVAHTLVSHVAKPVAAHRSCTSLQAGRIDLRF
jgi:ubiquinone/menaquinone biosynthesis C-methylase UbiE